MVFVPERPEILRTQIPNIIQIANNLPEKEKTFEAGGGMMSPCNSIGTLIDHLLSAVAPPWFAPAVAAALAAALAPLTRVAHVVS